MYMVTPIPVTDAVFAASSLTENDTDDNPLWTPKAFAVKNRVRRPNHRIYECLIAHTATNVSTDYPENNLTGNTPRWLEVGPTNAWAAFDTTMSTQSMASSDTLSWTLTPIQRFDTVTVFEVDGAASVRVRVTVAGVVKYDQTKLLRLRNTRSWSEFFLKPISFRRNVTFTGIPAYRNAALEVIVQGIGTVPLVGDVQFGRSDYIGDPEWKPSVRTIDYSGTATDTFGKIKFVPRRVVRVVEIDVFVENERFDEVCRLLRTAKQSVRPWLGDDRYDALNLVGFVQDFQIVLESPAGSFLNIRIQEVV
jgi:hypothetical protein